jgi:hypothetical protein
VGFAAGTLVITVEVASSTTVEVSASYKVRVVVMATVLLEVEMTVSGIVTVAGRVAALPHAEWILVSG